MLRAIQGQYLLDGGSLQKRGAVLLRQGRGAGVDGIHRGPECRLRAIVVAYCVEPLGQDPGCAPRHNGAPETLCVLDRALQLYDSMIRLTSSQERGAEHAAGRDFILQPATDLSLTQRVTRRLYGGLGRLRLKSDFGSRLSQSSPRQPF